MAALRAARGRTEPRLWTKPLRELTPETSYGFAVIEFAREVLGEPLDPWQEWLVIHAGELLEDGRPRFRKVLVLVARQNGKTHLLVVLALFWLFVEEWELILGSSTNLNTAKEAWDKAVTRALGTPELQALMPANGVRRANGDDTLFSEFGKYKFGAVNKKLGRGKSTDRLILDELREHTKWEAWSAAVPSMNARPYAQAWLLSNAGTDDSVVLNKHQDSCHEFLRSGVGDERFGIFEWSAPPGCDLLDFDAWTYANPNLNRRIMGEDLLGDALRAREKGGEDEMSFRTETLCQRIRKMDPAIDPHAWERSFVEGDVFGIKSRAAFFLDISPDRMHATLAAAAVLPDGRIRVQVVAGWQGTMAVNDLRQKLPSWVTKQRPRALGWMPGGPAAVFAADMTERKGRSAWPPPGVTFEAIRAEVTAVCMGFSELVQSGLIVHNNDPLLTAHVVGASKRWSGDQWKYERKGEGHCDAAYAAAGAVHLARTLPPPREKGEIMFARPVVVSDS